MTGEDRERFLEKAREVGPETVMFLHALWREAELEMHWRSLELLDLVRSYSAAAVERAVALAAARQPVTLRSLRRILERTDRDPTDPPAAQAGSPKLPEMSRQIGNRPRSAAIPRTGSR